MKTQEFEGVTYIVLETAEQADELVSDEAITDTLEGWFGEYRGVPEQDFIDRIVNDHGSKYAAVPFEIERYDNPGVKRLLSRARRIKRELGSS